MRTLKRLLFVLIFFSLSPSTQANNQQQTLNHLQFFANQYLRTHGKEEHFTGMGVTLQNPQTKSSLSVFTGTTGVNSSRPVNADSLFQVGSITKSFVSAILLQLESDPNNHFNIDDHLKKYFPEYMNWHAVTVKQLMNMSSGIPDYFTDNAIITGYTQYPFLYYKPKDWMNRISHKPLLFKPGTKFSYSNSNYFLLGMLIERITGHSLAYEIQHRIIKPLKLHHTYFVRHQAPSSLHPYLVHGYQYQQGFTDYIQLGADVTDYSLSYMDAAGAIVSNSEDIAKWAAALFAPGKFLSDTQWKKLVSVISETSGQPVNKLTKSDRDGYGLGIGAQYRKGLKIDSYIYFGMTFGYRAIYLYLPESKTIITVTVNSSFDVQKNHLLAFINDIAAHQVI